MAKTRVDLNPGTWDNWMVCFDHYPFSFRNTDAAHTIIVWKPITPYNWPEMIWLHWWPTLETAQGFADIAIKYPLILADVCPACNYDRTGVWGIRWNILRGQNRLWVPPDTRQISFP